MQFKNMQCNAFIASREYLAPHHLALVQYTSNKQQNALLPSNNFSN